jgi:uncharacterized membrane protein
MAATHLFVLYIEAYNWRNAAVQTFGQTPESANATASLAANQGKDLPLHLCY